MGCWNIGILEYWVSKASFHYSTLCCVWLMAFNVLNCLNFLNGLNCFKSLWRGSLLGHSSVNDACASCWDSPESP
jgi:hypothetical protein